MIESQRRIKPRSSLDSMTPSQIAPYFKLPLPLPLPLPLRQ
jgi:hypothetical protein